MVSKCFLLIGQNLVESIKLFKEMEMFQFSIAFSSHSHNLAEKIELLPYREIEVINFNSNETYSISNLNVNLWPQENSKHELLQTPKLIFHSSGSTEGFKWIFLEKSQAEFAGKTISEHLKLKPTDNLAITAPLFHTFGFNIGVLGSLHANCHFTHFSTLPKDQWLENLSRDEFTHIYAVPTIMQDLQARLRRENIKLKNLKGGIIGGARVEKDLFDYFWKDQGAKELTVGYGMTESSPIVTHTKPGDGISQSGEIGHLLPGLQYKISNQELKIKGYQVTRFITAKRDNSLHIDRPDWYATGDLVEESRDTFIYVGRNSQTIERGGEKLNVEAIEKALKAECLDFGLSERFVCFKAQSKDPRFTDQIGIAYEGQENEAVQDFLRQTVLRKYGNFFREINFIQVENLPYGDTGKVLRQEQQLTKRRIAS